MYQIDDIMQKCEAVVRSHALGGGQYARYLFQNAKGNRNLGPNEYGTADAVFHHPQAEYTRALLEAVPTLCE